MYISSCISWALAASAKIAITMKINAPSLLSYSCPRMRRPILVAYLQPSFDGCAYLSLELVASADEWDVRDSDGVNGGKEVGLDVSEKLQR